MLVRDIMTRDVECLCPGDSLSHAAEKMRDLNVGSLPVCEKDRLQGMITDRDITVRGTAAGRDPNQTKVSDIMTGEVVYCFDDEDVPQAARKMEEEQIRRLVVLNRDKRLVGIVAIGDLAVKGNQEEVVAEALERVSEPAAPSR